MALTTDLQLGSGELYMVAHTAPQSGTDTIPAASTVCVAANQVGYIKGGATITYTPNVYDVKSDMNEINEHFIASEDVSMKTGLLTWNIDVIKTLVNNETAISEQGASGILIGGKGFTKMDKYDIYFKATTSNGGKDRYFGFIGVSVKGLNLVYQPDKETVVDVEFKACADANGKLLRIEEATHV